ncbi:MAG: 50S ribosomal protein L9 [Blastocatellia bacterium]|nr:50S ribosomal protein L9 [Blastocatellia bacterium]
MEVLLIEDLDNLGGRGEIVRVKSGYGRNYLLPRKFAIEATPANKRMIEQQRKALLKREAALRSTAQMQAEQMGQVTLTFERTVGEHGILYGSVTALDVAEALASKGYEIDKRRVTLKEPIKTEGEFEVAVKLHKEVTTNVKVVVVKQQ